MSEERLREIEERYKGLVHAYWQSDTRYLLELVADLKRENEKLKARLDGRATLIADLKAELRYIREWGKLG